jgi:hypothetical protein
VETNRAIPTHFELDSPVGLWSARMPEGEPMSCFHPIVVGKAGATTTRELDRQGAESDVQADERRSVVLEKTQTRDDVQVARRVVDYDRCVPGPPGDDTARLASAPMPLNSPTSDDRCDGAEKCYERRTRDREPRERVKERPLAR